MCKIYYSNNSTRLGFMKPERFGVIARRVFASGVFEKIKLEITRKNEFLGGQAPSRKLRRRNIDLHVKNQKNLMSCSSWNQNPPYLLP